MAKKETKAQQEKVSDTPGVPVVQDEYVVGQVIGTANVEILDANTLDQYLVAIFMAGEMYWSCWKSTEQVDKIRSSIDPEFRKKKLLEKKAEIEKQLEDLDK